MIARDHPRVRGEEYRIPQALPPLEGSPPRARGRGENAMDSCGGEGITPACAGKSETTGRACRIYRDHPRVRGEETCTRASAGWPLGSPPRARGRAVDDLGQEPVGGITPACAGKRRPAAGLEVHLRDHPRVRGEEVPASTPPMRWRGSPPRARGRAVSGQLDAGSGGITPACAGKR